ncbi:hypothetical protein [Flavobacterium hibisci]|uniref:hypothetical protein n=1 Tax=Flavobacterium hibisci TaxID=1914462 RepID=UPI001CBC7405|nr:hypothetical protein [Flavobacterium hibisci]MBZ4042389.1 hypothetical protein [Flavobacterium hibisci]
MTNIFLNNTFINLNTNEVISNFNAGNFANIKKKNILSPPNFPNIEKSMNTLLNDKLLPEIERKIKRKIIIPQEAIKKFHRVNPDRSLSAIIEISTNNNS